MATVEDVRIIELPKFLDARGNLSFAEQNNHIPFEIKRTYWIYDVPSGMWRDGHAFRQQKELLVALSGSFDVIVHDGEVELTYHLSRPQIGLYIPCMTWRCIKEFSTNSVALVLSSTHYDEDDYIIDFEEFKSLKNKRDE